jgi:hypothetical protein
VAGAPAVCSVSLGQAVPGAPASLGELEGLQGTKSQDTLGKNSRVLLGRARQLKSSSIGTSSKAAVV